MKHSIVLISTLFTLLNAQIFDRGPTIQHKLSVGLYSPSETELGLPIYDELDMTGLGLQIGLFMNI